jgi:hypothetical protein
MEQHTQSRKSARRPARVKSVRLFEESIRTPQRRGRQTGGRQWQAAAQMDERRSASGSSGSRTPERRSSAGIRRESQQKQGWFSKDELGRFVAALAKHTSEIGLSASDLTHEAWSDIENELKKDGRCLAQLRGKLKRLRVEFNAHEALRGRSGIGWADDLDAVEEDEEVNEDRKSEQPSRASERAACKSMPFFEELSKIFRGAQDDGELAHVSFFSASNQLDPLDNDTLRHVVPEPTNNSAVGSRTWTKRKQTSSNNHPAPDCRATKARQSQGALHTAPNTGTRGSEKESCGARRDVRRMQSGLQLSRWRRELQSWI